MTGNKETFKTDNCMGKRRRIDKQLLTTLHRKLNQTPLKLGMNSCFNCCLRIFFGNTFRLYERLYHVIQHYHNKEIKDVWMRRWDTNPTDQQNSIQLLRKFLIAQSLQMYMASSKLPDVFKKYLSSSKSHHVYKRYVSSFKSFPDSQPYQYFWRCTLVIFMTRLVRTCLNV